jgi:hypothetical protein
MDMVALLYVQFIYSLQKIHEKYSLWDKHIHFYISKLLAFCTERIEKRLCAKKIKCDLIHIICNV